MTLNHVRAPSMIVSISCIKTEAANEQNNATLTNMMVSMVKYLLNLVTFDVLFIFYGPKRVFTNFDFR